LLLREIERERSGQRIERLYVSGAIEMLMEVDMQQSMKLYVQEFESVLIQQTRDFYRNEAASFIT
jgi:hypothetical protein